MSITKLENTTFFTLLLERVLLLVVISSIGVILSLIGGSLVGIELFSNIGGSLIGDLLGFLIEDLLGLVFSPLEAS